MSPSRLAIVLGPLIALVLIGGLVATVVRDPDRTELAQEPREDQASEPADDPATATPPGTASPAPTPLPTLSSTPAPDPSDGATPSGGATPATTASPGAQPGVGAQVGVDDPTALTGGWVGGTPNTGTAVSGVGLLLLLVGGGMLWLRRSRG